MRQAATFSESFRELGLLVFIVILCVIFQLRNHSFLTLSNIRDLLANTAILGILSVGMMMVLTAGSPGPASLIHARPRRRALVRIVGGLK